MEADHTFHDLVREMVNNDLATRVGAPASAVEPHEAERSRRGTSSLSASGKE